MPGTVDLGATVGTACTGGPVACRPVRMTQLYVSPHTKRRKLDEIYHGLTGEPFRVVGHATYADFHERNPNTGDLYPFYYWTVPVTDEEK